MPSFKRASVAVLVILSPYVCPTAILANQPVHVRSEIDLTVDQVFYTQACGFPVEWHIDGPIHATLFLDGEGNPVHEIDTTPSLRNTYVAPSTGKSVTYPGTGSLITDYFPDGTAIASLNGNVLRVHVPGGGPALMSTGRIVFAAVVTGTNPDGLPIIEFTGLISAVGVDHASDQAVCQALE